MTLSFVELEVVSSLEHTAMGGWIVNIGQISCQFVADGNWEFDHTV